MINLFNYQQLCVDFIKKNRGLILYHSMGSGKTITSLAMATQFKNSIIIIVTMHYVITYIFYLTLLIFLYSYYIFILFILPPPN